MPLVYSICQLPATPFPARRNTARHAKRILNCIECLNQCGAQQHERGSIKLQGYLPTAL